MIRPDQPNGRGRPQKGAHMRIIDVHAHLGDDCVFDECFTAADLLHKHDRCGIDLSIVQPGTCFDLETVRAQHDAIAALCATHPGRFVGMANPNPHLPETAYRDEVARCIRSLGFVGIKLHPFAHAAPPGGRDQRKVFEAALALDVPVMVHTGAGIPFANPSNLLAVCEAFPDVRIVMAHCGMMITSGEAWTVLERCPNTWADLSWTPGFQIERMAAAFGASRLMLASDHAENADTELAKIRACRLPQSDIDRILGGAAEALYRLPLPA